MSGRQRRQPGSRSPLPRFTTLTDADLHHLQRFFREWGEALKRPRTRPQRSRAAYSDSQLRCSIAGRAELAGRLRWQVRWPWPSWRMQQ